MHSYVKTALAIACCSVIASSWAQATGDLTFTGADRAGSKDGQIPAFEGAQVAPAGWSVGKLRGEYSPYKSEKPSVSITSENVSKYADKLSPGQLALFKQIKGYRMDVYPTHRDCGYPGWIQDNIKKNAGTAKLDASGNHLQAAVLPGLPFPAAKTGQEAIWNYLTRYRGVGVEWTKINTLVSPRPGSSDWIDVTSHQTLFFPWGKKGANALQSDEVLFSIYFSYESPAALAGQGLVQTFNFANNDTPTYYYFSGQRRVRRMPSYDYDAPQIGFENQYTVDEPWLFNGDIDRFDWKLVGKKEMYVPYNDFGMYDFKKGVNDVYKPNAVDPSARRYELHRVYVLEATLKSNMRHISQKKVLYLDEDTYLALAGEDYDSQGKLWKVKEGYPIPVWELGGTCDVEPFAQYNLTSGRYVSDQSVIGAGGDVHYFEQSNDPHFTSGFYSAENLRSISER
jgi:hypothetical protein